MARRTIDQQLADLQAKQQKQRALTKARALLDNLKTALHKREFHVARDAWRGIGAALDELSAPAATAIDTESDGGPDASGD